MDFYTYSYLQTHQQTITVVSYGIILGALLLILYYLLRYLHHRLITRYRDLSIVFLLFTLIYSNSFRNSNRTTNLCTQKPMAI